MPARSLDIACVGGGPAGLYFAVLAKRSNPDHRIEVFERNHPDDTFGFGVVFSENTMGFLAEQDRVSYPEIMAASRRWGPVTVIHGGQVVRCGGVGFAAVERRRLLAILRGQARELGVELRFQAEVTDLAALGARDLVVVGDGVGSRHRDAMAERFGTRVEHGSTRFTWLGTTRAFDSLTFFFERSEHGVFGVHAYPYARDRSTFIVETDEDTWLRAGMAGFTEEETIDYCERLFARHLDGHRLLSNRSVWSPFRTVHNRRWHAGNLVLVGDAAHTAHFSVGSGTRMAMEDGLALAQQLERLDGDVLPALAAFQAERRPRVEHIQRMAASSFDWWQHFRHYVALRPHHLAFHLLTRSQFRYDTLRDRDPGFLGAVEAEVGREVPAPGASLRLAGTAAVSPEGRVSPDERLASEWPRWEPARGVRVGLRLNHAGPRGACRPRSEGLDDPLPAADGWPLVAASPVAYSPAAQVPAPLDEPGMARVVDDFAGAARAVAERGYEWLDLQFGHGFLLGSFLAPRTNRRQDRHGGAASCRLRFPLRVLAAVRRVWPAGRLLSVAISADEDLIEVAAALRAGGCDAVMVLSGHETWRSAPTYGRVFNMLPAGKLRNEHGIPTIASGGIIDDDDVRTVLLSSRADFVVRDATWRGGA
jgi:anthraniloyl-CoA monooxygenase